MAAEQLYSALAGHSHVHVIDIGAILSQYMPGLMRRLAAQPCGCPQVRCALRYIHALPGHSHARVVDIGSLRSVQYRLCATRGSCTGWLLSPPVSRRCGVRRQYIPCIILYRCIMPCEITTTSSQIHSMFHHSCSIARPSRSSRCAINTCHLIIDHPTLSLFQFLPLFAPLSTPSPPSPLPHPLRCASLPSTRPC